jgi:sulfur carrier protein
MGIRVRVNGSEEILTGTTIQELLLGHGLDPAARGLAVAVNSALLPRRQWPTAELAAGDDIEIVRPFGGG